MKTKKRDGDMINVFFAWSGLKLAIFIKEDVIGPSGFISIIKEYRM